MVHRTMDGAEEIGGRRGEKEREREKERDGMRETERRRELV